MKTQPAHITIAAGALLAATPAGGALPATAHPETGVVKVIDCAIRSLSIQLKRGAEVETFVWNDSIQFSHQGGCALGGIDQRQSVRVNYRREVGQHVLRKVTAMSGFAECHASRE